ncbi:uncharacterized protein BJX67DRAFT_140150 [Aspergillus lucknowensis]|uniref:Uncharacterized protein n=1 Tax=Aspergillus lucknowensis TaxID=176173 RepID=A0ABR4LSU0_9EURO
MQPQPNPTQPGIYRLRNGEGDARLRIQARRLRRCDGCASELSSRLLCHGITDHETVWVRPSDGDCHSSSFSAARSECLVAWYSLRISNETGVDLMSTSYAEILRSVRRPTRCPYWSLLEDLVETNPSHAGIITPPHHRNPSQYLRTPDLPSDPLNTSEFTCTTLPPTNLEPHA